MPVSVIIVGAGMSGLCMGIKLQQAGIPFLILEKSERLGGTWWENTYPGCACDIPSHLYGLSFEPNPDWSRVFPPQPEILAYLEGIADKHGLREHIRFGVTVREARWDEGANLWRLTTADGEQHEAEVYVSAVGALHVPRYPDLPGREEFAGPSFHTARWNHDVDLDGKRVGVIGNGASAVQLVPHVAERAAHLTVFQRTPHWLIPKADHAYPRWVQRLFRFMPWLARLHRWEIWSRLEFLFHLTFRQGGVGRHIVERLCRRALTKAIADPDLRAKLLPDYQPGCKRILIANGYYEALARDDTELVTDPLQRITAEGADGEARAYPLDVLIYATGFDPLAWGHLEVYGRDGRSLSELWGDAPRAHLGMTVPGFPNYFVLLGPNTGLGHNSVMWMVECQVNYVLRCLKAMRAQELTSLEVRHDALEQSYERIMRDLQGMVWATCNSWYRNESGLIYALWPRSTAAYWWATRRPDLEHEFVRI